MEKEMFEGMLATLSELSDDMDNTATVVAMNGVEADEIGGIFAELATGIAILARTLASYAVTNEAAKVLLAEDGA